MHVWVHSHGVLITAVEAAEAGEEIGCILGLLLGTKYGDYTPFI